MAPCGGELFNGPSSYVWRRSQGGWPTRGYKIFRMDLDRPTGNEMHVFEIAEAMWKSRMLFVRVWRSRAALGFGLVSICLATFHREAGPCGHQQPLCLAVVVGGAGSSSSHC